LTLGIWRNRLCHIQRSAAKAVERWEAPSGRIERKTEKRNKEYAPLQGA
jgi:hypothetical protein